MLALSLFRIWCVAVMLCTLSAVQVFGQAAATSPSGEESRAGIEFESDTYDFGTARQGDIVRHTFTFTNTGTVDLKLQTVKPSCGCTTPEYTREPIKPGKKGTIQVAFNTATKLGEQYKSIAVTANTEPPQKILVLKGKVMMVETVAPPKPPVEQAVQDTLRR